MAEELRILLLEDRPADAELVTRELRKEGIQFSAQRVMTEPDFLAQLREFAPDLILADYSLPDYDGLSAPAAAQRERPEAPFIFVSGSLGEETAIEALRHGATDYVLKQRLSRLGAVVRRAFQEREEKHQRQQAEEKLRAAEGRYRALFEQSPDGIVIIDPATARFVDFNTAAHQQLGYSREEFARLGIPDLEAAKTPEETRERIAKVVREGKDDFETRQRTKQGELRHIHVTAQIVEYAGRPVYHCIWRDITERLQLEQQLRQSQKMEAVGQLAGGVAHDFNNMLAVIRGNAELLLMDADEHTSETTDCLKQITAASERAANLTRQLLAFSRKQVMQSRPLVLNDVIADLTKMLKRIIGEHIDLQCRCGAQLPFVQADTGMIEQVLVNLAVNARDAMPRDGQLLITTEPVTFEEAPGPAHPEARAGQFACLAVRDTGTGIAPEHLPRSFEPFFTTKEPGKGTGLGLATVYGIVQQHQGWIEVFTQPGAGATFSWKSGAATRGRSRCCSRTSSCPRASPVAT